MIDKFFSVISSAFVLATVTTLVRKDRNTAGVISAGGHALAEIEKAGLGD